MKDTSRRKFIGASALLAAGTLLTPKSTLASTGPNSSVNDVFMVGPKEGFTPHIGTMLSMMTMMRTMIVRGLKGLTVEELDFQIDEESNSIGAMLYHLAATEKYYQLNTFENIPWGEWDQSVKDEWDPAMNLGAPAREAFKGNDLDFYLNKLDSVRKDTIETFKTLDDEWLMRSDSFWGDNPVNNYAKWFHVCEHESNHNGQIKFIKGRFPKK